MNNFDTFRQTQRESSWSQQLREAVALQRLEGNPLSEEQLQMFEDFERRGLSVEERHAAINDWFMCKYGGTAQG